MSETSEEPPEGVEVSVDEDNPSSLTELRRGLDLQSLPSSTEEAKTYTFVVPPWELLACAAVPGLSFPHGSSFLRPGSLSALAQVKETIDGHPDGKSILFGHTDKAGGDDVNKGLSERRAKAVHAALVNDPAGFEAIDGEESWELDVVQTILTDLGHAPGPIDGEDGPKTQGAVKAFQEACGLEVDGIAGPNTRQKLYAEYLTKHSPGVAGEAFMDPPTMGCGEFNPIAATEEKFEPNRRVVLFVFRATRLPPLPCAAGDTGPCQSEIDKGSVGGSFRCNFYGKVARDCCCENPDPTPLAPATARQAARTGAPLVEECPLQHALEG